MLSVGVCVLALLASQVNGRHHNFQRVRALARSTDSNSSTPGDSQSDPCHLSLYSQRMMYLYMLMENMDQRSTTTYSFKFHIAANFSSNDTLSVNTRVILGLEDSDIMMALSGFQEEMSEILEHETQITDIIREVLSGVIPTTSGISTLWTFTPASIPFNTNNAVLFILSAMLNVNTVWTGRDDPEFLDSIVSQMPRTDETDIFRNLTRLVWDLHAGTEDSLGTPELYRQLQGAMLNVQFGRNVTLVG